jgi:hypothetical protein
MSKVYSVAGPSAAGSGPNTAVNIIATTAIRPMLNEVIVGISTTPADQTVQICASRHTAVGTAGSNPTPNPLDPSDVACVSTAGITHSGEPTYTASSDLLNIYLNQRATFRWVSQDGRELVAPATASNGIGVRQKTASASVTTQATVMFRE